MSRAAARLKTGARRKTGGCIHGMTRPRKPKTKRCARPGCPNRFPASKAGRPGKYCSAACRTAAYRQRGSGPKQRQLLTLIEGDARQLLPQLPAGCIDLIITDPPYEFDRGTTYFQNWFTGTLPDSAWPSIFTELHRVLSLNPPFHPGDRVE